MISSLVLHLIFSASRFLFRKDWWNIVKDAVSSFAPDCVYHLAPLAVYVLFGPIWHKAAHILIEYFNAQWDDDCESFLGVFSDHLNYLNKTKEIDIYSPDYNVSMWKQRSQQMCAEAAARAAMESLLLEEEDAKKKKKEKGKGRGKRNDAVQTNKKADTKINRKTQRKISKETNTTPSSTSLSSSRAPPTSLQLHNCR
eukprot:TRINITY_DN20950_c0_g1_i1.p1 TRINITY_DN20950_c0_g1~~TRINITY_DN20950_c0_g1_i1.p1  ORF type:complete len:198 (-),score=39.99 TRINITY_DN20950_c0_g1_i1:273-866(-)